MANSKESGLVKKIAQALRSRGAWATKIHGGIYQQGIPDILGCYRGYFLAFEVKLPKRATRVSDLQRGTINKIKAAKGVAMVITSKEEALAVLDRIDKVKDG